jgi:hypothetical protein
MEMDGLREEEAWFGCLHGRALGNEALRAAVGSASAWVLKGHDVAVFRSGPFVKVVEDHEPVCTRRCVERLSEPIPGRESVLIHEDPGGRVAVTVVWGQVLTVPPVPGVGDPVANPEGDPVGIEVQRPELENADGDRSFLAYRERVIVKR